MRLIRNERRTDQVMALLFRLGGGVVVLLVLLIIVGLGWQTAPLLRSARLAPAAEMGGAASIAALGSEPREQRSWFLTGDGVLVHGAKAAQQALDLPAPTAAADQDKAGLTTLLLDNGSVAVGSIRLSSAGSEATTRELNWRPASTPWQPGETAPWRGATAGIDAAAGLMAAAWSDRLVATATWNEHSQQWFEHSTLEIPGVRSIAFAGDGGRLAIVLPGGEVRVIRLPEMIDEPVAMPGFPVLRVRFLIGGASMVLAGERGEVAVALRVPRVEVFNERHGALWVGGIELAPGERAVVADDGVSARLAASPDLRLGPAPSIWTVARTLPGLGATPTIIAPAHRGRSFAVGGDDGTVGLYHGTSGRMLASQRVGEQPIAALAFAARDNAVLAASGGRVSQARLDNPNPGVSFRTLFLPVWYEGYAKPSHVWQTSGGSDSFQPKYSLWPLFFGTLKATFYAMLVSVPLALLAAIYVSQLAPARLQAVIKPTVELMAAVPSVIVGFIGALWLAPRLEAALLEVILAVASLPAAVVVAIVVWRALPGSFRQQAPAGSELVLLAMSFCTVTGLAVLAAGPVEQALFGGDLIRHLHSEFGIRYDQRNGLVVGLALGFAVIPVIFTIAEDACSSVPRSLFRAARALGATRWQAATRMVVPAAMPGMLAAVMLGFGRAVGETMIVLMASGNTPLLDGSPFNGMRTMSAAIAVEIPEAALGGPHFRVLFLTGLLLFVVSFAVTTAADSVSRRLRKRHAGL